MRILNAVETETRGVSVLIRVVPWRIAKPVRDLIGNKRASCYKTIHVVSEMSFGMTRRSK
jgi:hypothetical protein